MGADGSSIEDNRFEVEETGERHFLRDRRLLESALARPRNFFAFGDEDIVVLAVSVMAGIARAHPFEQGNKRIGFEAMWHFLRLDGYDLDIEDSQTWAAPVIDLIEHRSTEEDFARALRPYIVPLP
jgi:death on curing protein